MSKHVVVVGGGFAGLAAAVRLAGAGQRVTLVEKRPQLGGRAYSIVDETTGDAVDNGQHLFMGCYRATRAFLDTIGAGHALQLQERLRLAFVDGASGKWSRLAATPRLPQPLALVGGLAAFSALSWRDKLGLAKVATAIQRPSRLQPPPTDFETVDAWLDRLGQSAAARRAFFHPLALAALNDDPATASARMLAAVLREAFFGPGADGRLGVASVPLTPLYVEPAAAWLRAHGAELRLGTPVERVVVEDGVARGVALRGGEVLRADAVIAALPPPALHDLVDEAARADHVWWTGLTRLGSSPIVSVHLWLDRLVTDEAIVGVLGSPLHWIFHRNQLATVRAPQQSHLSLVVSAARELVDRPADAIVAALHGELVRLVPDVARARLLHSRVIKERHATIAHTAGTETLRPTARSPIAGLYAAGDWVRTGLPATIESAVRSADDAAALVLAYRPSRPVAARPSGATVSPTAIANGDAADADSATVGGDGARPAGGAFVPLGRLLPRAQPASPGSSGVAGAPASASCGSASASSDDDGSSTGSPAS